MFGYLSGTVDKILHQLIWIKDPILYRVSYMSGGAGFLASTVGSIQKSW